MSIKKKFQSIFSRKKMTEQQAYDIINAKFTAITKEEIEQTKTKLDEEFLRLLKDCNVDSEQTISVERAEEILSSLLTLAVSRRQQLADNLKSHVESGNIFNYYNDKIKEIDALQTELTTNLRFKKYLEQDYEYEKAIYKKIVGKTYMSDYVPDQQDLKSAKNDNQELEDELFRDLAKELGDE